MRSGLALAVSASATTASGSPAISASMSDRSTSEASGFATLASALPFFAAGALALATGSALTVVFGDFFISSAALLALAGAAAGVTGVGAVFLAVMQILG